MYDKALLVAITVEILKYFSLCLAESISIAIKKNRMFHEQVSPHKISLQIVPHQTCSLKVPQTFTEFL